MSFGKVKNNFYPFGEFPLDNEVAAVGFPFLTKYANADVNVDIRLSLLAGNLTIYWGDGAETNIIGPAPFVLYNHIYASALVDYDIRIDGDVDNVALIYCFSEPFSGDIANFAIFTALAHLHCYNTLIAGDVGSLAGLINMVIARINTTLISGDFASIKTWVSATEITAYTTAINTYTTGVLPNWDLCNLRVENNGWLVNPISNFWIDLDASSVASIQTVRGDGTNAALNAAGLVADASLIVKGWTTIHN